MPLACSKFAVHTSFAPIDSSVLIFCRAAGQHVAMIQPPRMHGCNSSHLPTNLKTSATLQPRCARMQGPIKPGLFSRLFRKGRHGQQNKAQSGMGSVRPTEGVHTDASGGSSNIVIMNSLTHSQLLQLLHVRPSPCFLDRCCITVSLCDNVGPVFSTSYVSLRLAPACCLPFLSIGLHWQDVWSGQPHPRKVVDVTWLCGNPQDNQMLCERAGPFAINS